MISYVCGKREPSGLGQAEGCSKSTEETVAFSTSTLVCTWIESQMHLLRNQEWFVDTGGHFSQRDDFAAMLFAFFSSFFFLKYGKIFNSFEF